MSDFPNARIHSNLGDIHAGDVGNGIKCLPTSRLLNHSSNLSFKSRRGVLLSRGAAEGDVAVAAAVGSPTKRHGVL